MYAVCHIAGRQLKVSPGETVQVDYIGSAKEGDPVVFDRVLLVSDGPKTTIGKPHVSAKVKATVVGHGRDDKILVYKKKKRTDYHKMHGHKQRFTTVRIDSIEL